jgi:hypothetical protein
MPVEYWSRSRQTVSRKPLGIRDTPMANVGAVWRPGLVPRKGMTSRYVESRVINWSISRSLIIRLTLRDIPTAEQEKDRLPRQTQARESPPCEIEGGHRQISYRCSIPRGRRRRSRYVSPQRPFLPVNSRPKRQAAMAIAGLQELWVLSKFAITNHFEDSYLVRLFSQTTSRNETCPTRPASATAIPWSSRLRFDTP